LLEKIEQVLDERVRPALRAHGGDIKALSFENGVFRFQLTGHCAGCPAADLTTESLVEKELTEAFPEISQVLLVQNVSEDLLAQAKEILSRHRLEP
jgi:Fe/S biogenesis protein NfuA